MKYLAETKFIDGRTLLIHFVNARPNIKGERFQVFIEKLERTLQTSLKGVRVILCPHPLKDAEMIEIHWSRFEENKFRLKDFIK